MKKKSLLNEKGQVLIFVTLAFVILGMFIGLAVDGGRAYLMRERLRSIIDAAALAGAKAMAGPANLSDALTAATAAACDSAKVNGLGAGDGECGSAGTKLTVQIDYVSNPDGNRQLGVIVNGTETSRTFFMALGGFIGCESCKTIAVGHVGTAVPDTLADVVLVMDDTGTMHHNCNSSFSNIDCPIRGAKAGANSLVDLLLKDQDTNAKMAFVPFRGCYHQTSRNTPEPLLIAYQQQIASGTLTQAEANRRGCILTSEMVDLSDWSQKNALKAQINDRFGSGGFPGTNICLGMHEGRKKLFDPQKSRAIARKIMVILTDGDQTYSDNAFGARGGLPNLGNPTPTPYPAGQYVVPTGDGGSDTTGPPTGSCKSPPSLPPGNEIAWGSDYDLAIDKLDELAMAKASKLKDPNEDNVEIYVLRFSDPADDTLTSGDPPGTCDSSLVGAHGIVRGQDPAVDRYASDDIRDRNLARCLASSKVKTNDHYFDAATPDGIVAAFTAIANDILKKRRLVA
jgi:hypothetical protein